MKKSLLIIASCSLFFFACKKDKDPVSQLEVASYPAISFTGSAFYSIPVGGSLPEISATASDSVTGESGLPVSIVGQDELDNTTPGLYIIQAEAKNKYGFISQENIYVAVTDISDDIDLSGEYIRTANSEPANITKLARGLYKTDDIGGAASLEITAYMVHVDENTLVIPPQPSEVGTISAKDIVLSLTPPDTTITYKVINPYFGSGDRTFIKQH